MAHELPDDTRAGKSSDADKSWSQYREQGVYSPRLARQCDCPPQDQHGCSVISLPRHNQPYGRNHGELMPKAASNTLKLIISPPKSVSKTKENYTDPDVQANAANAFMAARITSLHQSSHAPAYTPKIGLPAATPTTHSGFERGQKHILRNILPRCLHRFTLDGGAMHDAPLRDVNLSAVVHAAAIVPQDAITHFPVVRPRVFLLRGVRP